MELILLSITLVVPTCNKTLFASREVIITGLGLRENFKMCNNYFTLRPIPSSGNPGKAFNTLNESYFVVLISKF